MASSIAAAEITGRAVMAAAFYAADGDRKVACWLGTRENLEDAYGTGREEEIPRLDESMIPREE